MVGVLIRNGAVGLIATVLLLGFASGGAEAGYKEKVLYSFKGGSDGSGPNTALIMDSQGNLYGATIQGGSSGCNGAGCGTIFQVTPSGAETTLYSFKGRRDGTGPDGTLIADAQGNLYGTTFSGGGRGSCEGGCGTVFEVTPQGSESVLYAFTGIADGGVPMGNLILDAHGNLYGTAKIGSFSPYGEVFEVTLQKKETVLYSFAGGTDGGHPNPGLITDSQGNFYGTGDLGDHDGCGTGGCGTVFEVTPQGTETVLSTFAQRKNGADPFGLIADARGHFYGTTEYGGSCTVYRFGCGVVFKVNAKGKETALYSFANREDGAAPVAGLLADAKGNFYGTTSFGGGSCGCGTVFKVTPKGEESVLHSFTGGSDGGFPEAALIADSQGNLYGTTEAGGASGKGTVFELEKN